MTEARDRTDLTGEADLGSLLRALRRRADLSQRELAERAGVPQPTLARIESGRAIDPRYRTVERLVRAAGGDLAI
ncbi:MAG: helix-turn-helix domain-containing protein, partial [Actinoplanes sp.]